MFVKSISVSAARGLYERVCESLWMVEEHHHFRAFFYSVVSFFYYKTRHLFIYLLGFVRHGYKQGSRNVFLDDS